MLRANVKEGTELGKEAKRYMDAGDLVPDELIVKMAAERLQEPDAQDGFILDGFPRTIEQAKALDKQLSRAGTPGHRRAAGRRARRGGRSGGCRAAASASRRATTTTSNSTRPSTRASATRTARG